MLPFQSLSPKRPILKRRTFIFLCCICLFLSLAGIPCSLFIYPTLYARYQEDLHLAYQGASDLQAGALALQEIAHDPFNNQLIEGAQTHFAAGLTAFHRVAGDLALLPDVVNLTPVYGKSLQTDKDLAVAALETAQMGVESCAILHTLAAQFRNSLNSTQGFTMSDLGSLQRGSQQIEVLLEDLAFHVKRLQSEGTKDSNLTSMIHTLSTHLPPLFTLLQQLNTIFTSAPLILGIASPAHYLIELLDTDEMRPGGGFVGNYGIATIVGGHLQSATITDSYLLDNTHTQKVLIPSAYSWFTMAKSWSLHDSNLDADFPTSARNAEMLYQQARGTFEFQGVIALTPALLESILDRIGPISVPEYHEVITAQNLVERVHYHQLVEEGQKQDTPSPDGYSSLRKHFTALLTQAFLTRMHMLPSTTLSQLFPIFINALHTKDVQIFFNSDGVESVLHKNHLDSSIQSSVQDNLLVVQANISPSKINGDLITTINDQVTLDSKGAAIHATSINFTWIKSDLSPNNVYGSLRYLSYVRLYLPSNSHLLTQPGWRAKDTGTVLGRAFWGGYYAVNYPSAGSLMVRWVAEGAAHKDGQIWHYQYQLQRQAGALQNIHISVYLPKKAKVADLSIEGIRQRTVPADIVEPLRDDKTLSVNFITS